MIKITSWNHTKVLTVAALLPWVYLKYRQVFISVNFIARRLADHTNFRVKFELKLLLEVEEAVGADVQNSSPVLFWERGVKACLDQLIGSVLNELYCLHSSPVVESINLFLTPSVMMDFVGEVRELLYVLFLFSFFFSQDSFFFLLEVFVFL